MINAVISQQYERTTHERTRTSSSAYDTYITRTKNIPSSRPTGGRASAGERRGCSMPFLSVTEIVYTAATGRARVSVVVRVRDSFRVKSQGHGQGRRMG